jgi:hypothetical protein
MRSAASCHLIPYLRTTTRFHVLILALSISAFTAGRSEADNEQGIEEPPSSRLDFGLSVPRGSVGLRGGWAFNSAEGEIYDFLVDQLTLEKSDFGAPSIIFDLSWRLISWLDVVVGVGYTGSETESEDRYFSDTLGIPVVQYTRLSQVPVLFSAKLYPLGRGRQIGKYAWIRRAVIPYIGGGIGATWYQLEQRGEFVDKGDPFVAGDEFIFEDVFVSSAWAFAQHVFIGVDIKLTRNVGLILEGRLDWAKADVEGSFVGFDPINLDGARILIGINANL